MREENVSSLYRPLKAVQVSVHENALELQRQNRCRRLRPCRQSGRAQNSACSWRFTLCGSWW